MNTMKPKKKKAESMMIRLPSELKAQLEALAATKGMGASTLVRMILIETAHLYITVERKVS